MTYTVRTNTYGKHHAGYVPVFQDKSLKMVGQFLAIEGNNFMPNIQEAINFALGTGGSFEFAGNIYHMSIHKGVATFTNAIDDTDPMPRAQISVSDLKDLVEHWIPDVRFLSSCMKQLPAKTAFIKEYLEKKYNYTEQRAADVVEYLMQAREVAVEFVYYIEHGEFIPERYASNFHGYTAKQLNNKPFLSLLGAFNYMVYLKTKPERALAHIEKSFPRRVIINAEEEAQLLKGMNMD